MITKDVTFCNSPIKVKDNPIKPTRQKKTSGIEAIIKTPKSKMPIHV